MTRFSLVAAVLLVSLSAVTARAALSDNITLTFTNAVTHQPAVVALQRYSIRATNYQVRIYSDATNFTLLASNQIPEVTTYRGRIATDPGAMVVGSFDPSGNFIYLVSYGCREVNTDAMDPYDTTNRVMWGGWGASIATTNVPEFGYTYSYQTNMPARITWATNNYPAATPTYGGPPRFNNLQQVPVQRVRIIQDMSRECFINSCGSNVNYAVLMQDSRINEMDYLQARDFGICYQVVCVCIRPETEAPFTSGGNSRLADLRTYWSADPGWAGDWGANTNAWFDMVQGTMNLGGGVAYCPGDYAVTDPGYFGCVEGHEVGHNWGADDVTSLWDYTGENRWHWAQTGSGYGYSTEMINRALGIRRYGEYYKSAIYMEWVKYNSPVAPWASPDFATTRTNQAVSVNVLVNDHCANSNAISVVSFEASTPGGGVVTNLGNGVLRYTPPAGFTGYDWFHYYVGESSGLKSLSEVHVKVVSDTVPLLAQWSFNQTNGLTLTEATGRGVAGTLQGTASFTAGADAGINNTGALHLDGAGYVQFPGRWFDPLESSWTLSLWCKPDATPSSDQVLFSKADRSGANGLFLAMNGSSFYLSGATFGINAGFAVSANLTPQAGRWYHVVAEVDRTNSLARLWVNGVEYTSTSSTRSIPAAEFVFGEAPPALGGCPGRGYYLSGTLDEVQLFGRALTQAEITALYVVGGMLPASVPNPADGEPHVSLTPALSWTAGRTNYQHDVYFGTNATAVATATTNSPEYKGRLTPASYSPGALSTNTDYYWRIDEVQGGTNFLSGDLWRFSTAQDQIHGGMRLHLTLDNRDILGNVAYDSSGPPFNDGTIYNSPTQSTGRVGEALAFNGSSSYIGLGNPDWLNFTGRITVAAWIRPTATNGLYNIIEHGYRTGPSQEVGLRISSGYYQILSWDGANHQAQYAIPAADLTNWVHLAGEYDGTAWRLFRNGAQVAVTTNATGSILVSDNWSVGATGSGAERFFPGSIDDVMMWNRALSAAEINSLYTNGLAGYGIDGAPPVPQPGTFTWTGAADNLWTNAANWSDSAVPAATNLAIFDESSARNLSTDPGADFAIRGVSIRGDLRGVGIGGTNGFALLTGADGIQMSNTVATLTLSAPVTLTALQTWSVSQSAALNDSGAVTEGAYRLTWDVDGTLTESGVISGSGGLVKTGSGTATLNSNQDFAGGVVVSNGVLEINAGGWYVNPFGQYNMVTIGTGATVRTGGAHSLGTDANGVTINGGTLHLGAENYISGLTMAGGTVEGGELRTWGGTMTFNASTQGAVITAPFTLVGSATLNVADGAAAADLSLRGSIGSSGGLTKSGAGVLLITGQGAYGGATAISGGRVQLAEGDDRLPPANPLTLGTGTTLEIINVTQTINSFSGLGAIVLSGGAFVLNNSTNITYGGVISGQPGALQTVGTDLTTTSGGLTKEGAATLTLTNACTYSGDTYVAGGALALQGAGSIALSSNLIVGAGASIVVTNLSGRTLPIAATQALRGFGQVRGATRSGGTVDPGFGSTPGLFTITGNYTQQTAGVFAVDIASTNSFDSLSVTGTASLAGTLLVRLQNGFTPEIGSSFTVLSCGARSGMFTSNSLPDLPPSRVWSVGNTSTSAVLSVMAASNYWTVSVSAADPTAAEYGLDEGQFLFTRSGYAGTPLTVFFSVSGTASSGEDYGVLSTSVVFSAEQTQVALPVSPIEDLLTEGAESVVVTLVEGTNYSAGAQASATVSILDDDGPPTVTITDPATNAVNIPAGVGMILGAVTGDDGYPIPPGAVTTLWTQASGPGTVAFGDASSASTTARFSTNGTYVLQIEAGDGQFLATDSVTVVVGQAAHASWDPVAVGYGGATGTLVINGSAMTITGASSGIDLSGATDGFYGAGQDLDGDFDLRAKVTSASNITGTSNERAGIAVRQGTNVVGNEISFFVGVNGSSSATAYRLIRGSLGGANTRTTISSGLSLPYWVRMVRIGSTTAAYIAGNGTNWTSAGSVSNLTGQVRAVVLWSSDSGTFGSASFTNVSLLADSSANVGAQVDAGPAQSAQLPRSITLAGAVSDDGKPNPPGAVTCRWEKVSGPGVFMFGDASATNTTASMDQIGDYTFRLTADDGEVITYDETTVSASGAVLRVTAPDAAASEEGLDAASFLISRSGPTDAALTVNLLMSGSAGEGVDYQPIGTAAVIDAGATGVVVAVTPLDDRVYEGDETVTLTLSPGAIYTVGDSAAVTATIADNETQTRRMVWNSVSNQTWDVAGATNWYDVDNAVSNASFANGKVVVFEDESGVQSNVALSGPVIPAAILVTASSTAYTVSGGGRVSGAGGIQKTGGALFSLGGSNNDYTGAVTISCGVFRALSPTALGATNEGTLVDGGALDVNGQDLGDESVTISGAGPGGRGAIMNSGPPQTQALRMLSLSGPAAIGGAARWDLRGPDAVLSLAGFTLTKVDSNVVTIAQATVTDGDIIVDEGTFGFENGAAVGGDGTVTVQPGATLQVGSFGGGLSLTRDVELRDATIRVPGLSGAITVGSAIALAGQSGTVESGDALFLAGEVSGAGELVKTGGATLYLTGTTTYSGATAIAAGVLEIGGAGQLGAGDYSASITNAGLLRVNTSAEQVLGGVISGTGAVAKVGDGTLTLGGSNTYVGGTAVGGGVLRVTGTLGSGDVDVGGGTLSLGSSTTIADEATLTIQDGGVVALDGGVNESVSLLYLGGNAVRSGTWGSSASPAEHTDDAHFSGSGVLSVNKGLNSLILRIR